MRNRQKEALNYVLAYIREYIEKVKINLKQREQFQSEVFDVDIFIYTIAIYNGISGQTANVALIPLVARST